MQDIFSSKTSRLLVFFMFAFLFVVRLALLGNGYLDDSDELPYIHMLNHIEELSDFDVQAWLDLYFHTDSPITENIIRFIQTLFLIEYAKYLDVSLFSNQALYLIGLFNSICFLFILIVSYRIFLKLDFDPLLALLGIVLLGTYVNTSVYIRHILPYDHALLFQLISLLLLLSKTLSNKKIFIAGFFSVIGFLTYYGYFMFVFVCLVMLFFRFKYSMKYLVGKMAIFLIPYFALFFFIELFAQVYDDSFIEHMLYFSSTITQGSFNEGLNYVFIYFYLVEKFWGVFLLVLFTLGLILTYKQKEFSKAKQVLFIAVLAYLLYGSYVWIFEQMVFYGRILHMYYVFIVIGVLYFVQQQKLIKKNLAIYGLMLLAFINYAFVIKDLSSISYPRSVINRLNLKKGESIKFNYVNELNYGMLYDEREFYRIYSAENKELIAGNYILQNFCFFQHYPDSFMKDYRAYKLGEFDSIVFDKPHFMSHPFYTMEYCTKAGRNFFLEKQFRIKVIKLAN